MSTKITHGFIAAPGTSPLDLARRLRTALDPIRDRLDSRLLAGLAVAAIDSQLLAGEAVAKGALVDAMLKWEGKQAELGENDRRRDPHRFEAAIGEDPETGLLHVLAFTDREEYLAALTQDTLLTSYPYWNNTDKPDDVTDQEWSERAEAWNRAWPEGTAPAESMLMVTHRVRENPGMLRLMTDRSQLVLDEAPSRAQRARRRIVARVAADRIRGVKTDSIAETRTTVGRLLEQAATIGESLASVLPEFTWELALEGSPADPRIPEVLAAEAAALAELEGTLSAEE